MRSTADYDDRLIHCPLCKSGSLRPYDRDFRGHGVDRCIQCGVLLMNPQYSDTYLERFYSTYLTVHDQNAPAPERRKSHPEIRREAKRRSLELVRQFVEPGRLLMVGCGDGLELELAQQTGWNVEGYDVDPSTTADVAAKFGVPVHSGSFPDLDLPTGHYDVVFMDQVIEHLKDPGPYLVSCKRLLRKGGVLFLGMPNIGSVSNRGKSLLDRLGLKRRRRGNHYASKHHVFYYSPAVLARALREHYGFDVLTTRGSLKPQRNPITPLLSRWLPSLDSGFILLARNPEQAVESASA